MPQCTDEIVANLSDPVLFSTWKTSIQTQLNTLSTATDAAAKDTGITRVETQIAKYLGCAQEKLAETEKTPNDVVSLQEELARANSEITDAENDVNVSKERAKLLRNPERNTTIYESWFPLFRPMKLSSSLLILGLTLFMFCVVFGYLMNLFGLFVDIGYRMRTTPGGLGGFLGLSPLTIGLILLSVSLAAGLIYYVSK